MRVSVIGTGYVGLVTGACLAHIGHDVVCVDNNIKKVATLQAGQSPIYEPGLTDIMQSERLSFTTDLAAGVNHGEILFIAVGTPPLVTGESDTRYVEAVARGIGQHIGHDYKVIVNKSTVPVGSGDWVRRLILDEVESRNSRASFDVVSNPEFLREGAAVYDTFNPDRIVLGSQSPKAIERMRQLYTPIIYRQFAVDTTLPEVPLVVTDLASAETIKYAANAFLATKISFINEIANICDRIGADVTQVSQGIGLDSRIGQKFLQAGIGWGGSCFPKDVSALMHIARDYGVQTSLLDATIATNQRQRLQVVYQLQKTLKILKGKTIGLLGLTFKPNTDDMRDAPALAIIAELKRLGAKVKAYDPIIEELSAPVTLVDTPTTLAYNCDALVLVTDWAEFQDLDYGDLARRMTHPIFIDGRNCLNPQRMQQAGFYYQAIGRPSAGQLLWPIVNRPAVAFAA